MATVEKSDDRARWITKADWPHDDGEGSGHSVWKLNDTEFVVSARNGYNECSLHKYNLCNDSWSAFQFGLKDEVDIYDASIDVDNGRVFVQIEKMKPKFTVGLLTELLIFDIQTKSLIHRVQNMSSHGKMVNVNGSIHLVGYESCVTPPHSIWNEAKVQFEPINVKPIPEIRDFGSLFHVPSKNILLMICSDTLGSPWNLCRYHIASKVWEKVMVIGRASHPRRLSATLTSDEQFVIITDDQRSHLQILDMRNDDEYKLRESSVEIPIENRVGNLGLTDGKKHSFALTSGWIRRLNRSARFRALSIPLEIERIIAEWYSTEWIHWIMGRIPNRRNLRNHQTIPLKDILKFKLEIKTVMKRSCFSL